MMSLVEVVAVTMLFIATPVIAVWVMIGLARVIETIGDLPIDESETLAIHEGRGAVERLRRRAERSRT
jgi:hypothetical protein